MGPVVRKTTAEEERGEGSRTPVTSWGSKSSRAIGRTWRCVAFCHTVDKQSCRPTGGGVSDVQRPDRACSSSSEGLRTQKPQSPSPGGNNQWPIPFTRVQPTNAIWATTTAGMSTISGMNRRTARSTTSSEVHMRLHSRPMRSARLMSAGTTTVTGASEAHQVEKGTACRPRRDNSSRHRGELCRRCPRLGILARCGKT